MSNIDKSILETCRNIPYNILDLHRVFIKSTGDKVTYEFIKKNDIDRCLLYADWYEYSREKLMTKRVDRGLVSSDPIIEKYSNVESFLDECCIISTDHTIQHALLYRRYAVWCQTSRIPVLDIRSFIKSLKKLGYVFKLDSWIGIKLA